MSDAWAVREQRANELAAFIRYRHRIDSEWQAMRENWSLQGPDVWHVFIKDGVEKRYYAPLDAFEEWEGAE